MNLMTLLLLAGLVATGCRRILAATKPLPTRPSEVRHLEVSSLLCVATLLLWLLLFEYRAPGYSPQILIDDQVVPWRNVKLLDAILLLRVLAIRIYCAWKFNTKEVNERLQNLRCPRGADESVANIPNNIFGTQLELLHKKMSHFAIRDNHVIALSRDDNQNVRIVASLAVLPSPTKSRVRVLEQLPQDESPSVHSRANEAFAKLQKMRCQELPSRHQILSVAGAN